MLYTGKLASYEFLDSGGRVLESLTRSLAVHVFQNVQCLLGDFMKQVCLSDRWPMYVESLLGYSPMWAHLF